MRRILCIASFVTAGALSLGGSPLALPNHADSVKFAVIGDGGTGDAPQFEVATEMAQARRTFPFDFVLMVGDNFYGGQAPTDLVKKFDRPYKPLLDAGVTFHAVLGNHDESYTVDYPPLNMAGQRYYTFARRNVRFFAFDSNALDTGQLEWIEGALQRATEDWKVCYFHHPLYSNGARHGGEVELRVRLEPLLRKYGVKVVFSGHDHDYERLVPQYGIQYFVTGSAGQLRRGGLNRSATTAAGYDDDRTFLLIEIDGDALFFEALSRTGAVVDSGTILRQGGTS
jgi:3',5'-cyclic AMP phosphodiesterase CpdA